MSRILQFAHQEEGGAEGGDLILDLFVCLFNYCLWPPRVDTCRLLNSLTLEAWKRRNRPRPAF